MGSLTEITTAAAGLVAGVSGIRAAPSTPPEDLAYFPFAVVYPGSGAWEFNAAGEKKGLHNLVVEVHVARKDLGRDVAAAMAFSDSVPNALMKDPTLGGKADTFQRISYTFGALGWGGVETVGFRFTVEGVKARSGIT